MTKIVGLFRSETAATAIEYGLIAAFIAVGCIGAFTAIADSTSTKWNTIETESTKAMN
ncbi:Flp family type IVb pilin [Sphingorhabdus soli]|uniref:Flp family type IVb pilin n=1 Tax=Flavisphingopyxis soli TaxID=2601267 RepID=A0A5C6U7E4_9SPHN|nr:Flp family type IVb pilin [Sphingorhabdus soli]TXC68877.1 Flp family type IVb pilin [Sphingorhabdus soli]